jgi:hypothetical protein
MVACKRLFAFGGGSAEVFAASEGFRDDAGVSILANFWEMVLELITYPGEVAVDGYGFDVVTHVDGEEAESLGCWFDGKIMHFTESEARVKSGGISGSSARVN